MGAGIAAALRDAGSAGHPGRARRRGAARGIATVAASSTAPSSAGGSLDGRGRASRLGGLDRRRPTMPPSPTPTSSSRRCSRTWPSSGRSSPHSTRACRADAILATNTSYLDPRAIADGAAATRRAFVGLHFFSPAHVMKLLEIVPTAGDDARDARHRLRAGARARQDPGAGRHLRRLHRQPHPDALPRRGRGRCCARGAAIAEIDAAMRGFGFAMGPFEVQDLGGLDIAYLQREAARARGEAVPETPRRHSGRGPAARARRPAPAGTTTAPATARRARRPRRARPARAACRRERDRCRPADDRRPPARRDGRRGRRRSSTKASRRSRRHRPRRGPRLRLPALARRADVHAAHRNRGVGRRGARPRM